jgi:haloacetate dehalogenase
MSELADLFPGFESHWIPSPEGKIFARSSGKGVPLILLHGFPQTHVMWHRVAARLATQFQVIAMDLRGYGWSSAPHSSADHDTYSKRAMGADVLAVMEHFGHAQVHLAGHDRGGRVGYRLALDHPGRVAKLAVIDIIPTAAMWPLIDAPGSTVAQHWKVLSQPAPLPEDEIKASKGGTTEYLALWSGARDLKAFDPRALQHYRAFSQDSTRVSAMCEDYRAGSTLDRAADEADLQAGRAITGPVLALWGTSGIPAAVPDPLASWRPYAPHVSGHAIAGGHFLPEENPAETSAALLAFFGDVT